MVSHPKFIIRPELFAIVKAKKNLHGAFATIDDGKEFTLVIDQSKLKGSDNIAIEKNWKIITYDGKLPFELIGFVAKVSNALADEGISIFVISAYSTDHILVKEKQSSKALEKLNSLEMK